MTPEVRARLDQHLDAVESALTAAGHSRDHRRAILDDLESQIRDILAARSPSPSLADVTAILAQLDPPQAYAASAESNSKSPIADTLPSPNHKQFRLAKMAVIAFLCVLVSLMAVAMLLQLHLLTLPTPTPSTEELSSRAFLEILKQGQFSLVEVMHDDGILLANYKDGRPQRVFTRWPSSALDATGWSELVRLSEDSGTPIKDKPSRSFFFKKVAGPSLVAVAMLSGLLGTLLAWTCFARSRKSPGFHLNKFLALLTGILGPVIFSLLALAAFGGKPPP